MKKIKIALVVLSCILVMSCGNLGSMMSGTGISNAISSVIGLDKVKAGNLIGAWNYSGPGCAFTSENLLAKAGGEMAAVSGNKDIQTVGEVSKKYDGVRIGFDMKK